MRVTLRSDKLTARKKTIEHVMGTRQSSDTLLRQWTMLRRIPREPRWISTAELKNALAAEGLDFTVRTIQRDLEKLSAIFPLRSQRENRCNPLGLVVRGGVSYLVCTLWGYNDVRHLALHRMSEAELLNIPAKAPPAFDMERYIKEDGGFSYPLSRKPIKLRVLFDKGAAAHLYETPLTLKQRLTERKDGRCCWRRKWWIQANCGGGCYGSAIVWR